MHFVDKFTKKEQCIHKIHKLRGVMEERYNTNDMSVKGFTALKQGHCDIRQKGDDYSKLHLLI